MTAQINKNRVTQLLSQMVQIESINPDLVPGGSGEKKVAEFIANFLQDVGLEAEMHKTGPNHYNIVGILPGTGGGKTLLIDGHLDTVSVEGMEDPFSGKITGDKLYGRGAADNKGGVAAAVEALITLKESGVQLSGDVIVAGVSGEEYASEGTEALIRQYGRRAQGCIIAEPSRMDQGLYLGIGVGSGGYAWIEYKTHGERAHGSLYRVGVDAIEHMGDIISELANLKEKLLGQEPYINPLATFGAGINPSIHNSIIQGGYDLATYPDKCTLSVERRMVYGEDFDLVENEIDDVINKANQRNPGLQVETRLLFKRSPWEAQPGALLSILEEEVALVLGSIPSKYAIAGWDDGAISSAAGIPTVVFGPSGNGWHGPNEYVDLNSLYKSAQAIANTALRFCQ